MHPVARKELEQGREAVATLCREYGVRRLWLFGSATGPEFDPGRSDFDFAAEFGRESYVLDPLDVLIRFPERLSESLGRRVDVTDWSAAKNPFFRRSVERARQEIYASQDG